MPTLPIDLPPGSLNWDNTSGRQIETGLDRGVIYMNDGRAVPWLGLTAVDEVGGTGAVEYYIDGRPYLYFPTPKEFKASLKAYTYPDAFGEVLGEIEATDGMYLDSQIPDSFGLSYRTKIADAVQGENAGYKIHIIYNATAVPSTKSYVTIGSAVSPLEFSWDLQAVPVSVAGYRPTAHITIDTRHMDNAHISEIETLLYGTTGQPAELPDPQTIFDLLNFGTAIVIIDNGDGTWTAESSYHNVYMVNAEKFEIANSNAVNHGDGTYTISSSA